MQICLPEFVIGKPRPPSAFQDNTADAYNLPSTLSRHAHEGPRNDDEPTTVSSRDNKSIQELKRQSLENTSYLGNQAIQSYFMERIKRSRNPCVKKVYTEYDSTCQISIKKFVCHDQNAMACLPSSQYPYGKCKELYSIMGGCSKKYVSGCECYVSMWHHSVFYNRKFGIFWNIWNIY